MTVGTRFMRTSQSLASYWDAYFGDVFEHRALRLLGSPRREGELVGMNQCQLPALSGPEIAAPLICCQ